MSLLGGVGKAGRSPAGERGFRRTARSGLPNHLRDRQLSCPTHSRPRTCNGADTNINGNKSENISMNVEVRKGQENRMLGEIS